MSRARWLTPSSLEASTTCRRLLIPDSVEWESLVTGALLELCFPYNWEPFGTVTPNEAAARAFQMFNAFTAKDSGCRVVGEVIPYAGSISPYPDEWFVCDGRSLVRTDYEDLFNVIGTTYGALDSLHFNIPDLRGRVALGAGHGSGLSDRPLGTQLGEETHTLTASEIASHTHTDSGHTHSEGAASPTIINGGLEAPASSAFPITSLTGLGYANITASGGDNPHNNIQPSLAINYLIVAK